MKVPSCMIFAAGFGTRMGALTEVTPKPMLAVGGRPMIDRALDLARSADVRTIVANTHHLHEIIAPHLAARNVTISHESPDILDTGGGLRFARPHLSNPTLTLNPDVLYEGPNPLKLLIDAWRDDIEALLLAVPLSRAVHRAPPGDFSLDGSRLTRGGDMVYTGAQMIRTDTLDHYPPGAFSLNRVWDDMAKRGTLHGVAYPGRWTDIGTAEALARANGGTDV